MLVNDRVHLVDVSATMQVIRLAETFQPLETSKLGEDVHTTPAFVGERIYLRGVIHLFCNVEPGR